MGSSHERTRPLRRLLARKIATELKNPDTTEVMIVGKDLHPFRNRHYQHDMLKSLRKHVQNHLGNKATVKVTGKRDRHNKLIALVVTTT